MDRTFLIEYADNGDVETRARHRDEHIAYRKGLGERIMLAGPILDDVDTAVGSLILLQARDRAEAEQAAGADPLVTAGVLTVQSIRPYRIAKIAGS